MLADANKLIMTTYYKYSNVLIEMIFESGKFPIKHKHDHSRDNPIIVTRVIDGHTVTCTCTREFRCFDYAGWALNETRRWNIDGKRATKKDVLLKFGNKC